MAHRVRTTHRINPVVKNKWREAKPWFAPLSHEMGEGRRSLKAMDLALAQVRPLPTSRHAIELRQRRIQPSDASTHTKVGCTAKKDWTRAALEHLGICERQQEQAK